MAVDITISIEIPVGMTQQEVVRLFTDHFNYESATRDMETPPTRAQFAKEKIAQYVRVCIRAKKFIEDTESRGNVPLLDIVVS